MGTIVSSTTFIFFYVNIVFTQIVEEEMDYSKGIPVHLPNRTCGIDNSPISVVYEGVARIETYPWMGVLLYPYRRALLTTAVILVTKEIVISSALDIHKLPKKDFRENAKVILGHNCSGPRIGVLDYNYHPEYKNGKNSALVLIQLNLSYVEQELRPICEPPDSFTQWEFHAMVLPDDCKSSKINIYEMIAVPPEQCKRYYRKSGLDIESIWPTHTVCGKAKWGGQCLWRNGAALVVKQDGRWHLLGFGVHGPGCKAPSRFVDYGMYRRWVTTSLERMGRPAVTRMAPNHLILRRTSNTIQRYGACDAGELRGELELYSDRTEIQWNNKDNHAAGKARYNLTIDANCEYGCVIFRADYNNPASSIVEQPEISLKRYCTTPGLLCFGGGVLKIEFYVEIYFTYSVMFTVAAYGRQIKEIDPKSVLLLINNNKPLPEIPWTQGMPIPTFA